MFRRGRVAFLGASSALIAVKRVAFTYAEQQSELSVRDKEKETLQSAVVISLSSQSRDNLKEYLDMNKYQGVQGNYVVINKGLTEGDLYQYEPLFGERAAFRLKGVIQNSKKSMSVSNVMSLSPYLYILHIIIPNETSLLLLLLLGNWSCRYYVW